MRSARAALFIASLALVLVPLGAMAVAWAYEWWLISSHHQQLATIAAEVTAGWPADDVRLKAVAEKYGVLVRVMGPDGSQRDFSAGKAGEEAFWVKGPFENVSDLVAPRPQRESLEAADATFGPLNEREEMLAARGGVQAFAVHFSPSGETAAMVLATPLPDGRVVAVTRASHRGVRRLLALRREMTRLALYQAGAALVGALLLARWLVRPLTRLAASAARYPDEPLASAELLARRDEIGQLARAMTGLASTLERRRRDAVDRAADVAHEFKNPLATIVAAAEHLSSTHSLTDEKRLMLSQATAGAALRLLATTEALLKLARLEAALPEEPKVAVGYRDFLEALVATYRADARWAGVEFSVTVAPAVGEVQVAPAAWEHLLRNLIDNALAQPAEKKRVEVAASFAGGAVLTAVKDSGPGVAQGNRDKIFRRFFTDRPAGTPPGTGLGLSIVQAVAEAHGASVSLSPSVPGEGATFVVTLP